MIMCELFSVDAAAVEFVGGCPALDGSGSLLIGFSVRNRSFDRAFFQIAGELARSTFANLIVAILDVPYAFNDAARRGAVQPSERDLAKAVHIGDERQKMVERVLSKIDGLAYEIRRWPELENANVRSLRDELATAVHSDSLIRDLLMSYAAHWAASANEQLTPAMTGFQVCELPVLFDLYYREGLLHDLYPGEIVDFFFRLERGDFASALPMASRLAHGHKLSCLRLAAGAGSREPTTLAA